MILIAWISAAVLLIVGRSANCTPAATSPPATDLVAIIPADKYPTPKRDESVQDTYAKTTVIKDPYRWLENLDSPETKKFIEDEMAITKPYLEQSPFREELTARYKELLKYPTYIGPVQIGKKFISFQNTGLQDQNVVYIHDTLSDEGRTFFDPNTLSKDGSITMDSATFSNDGLVFAYMTSEDGSEWETLQFKHVERSDIYTEKLTKVKFLDITFTRDNKGLFYSAFPDYQSKGDKAENELFYHFLGTEQSKDILVVEFPRNPDYSVSSKTSHCGKYLIVYASGDTGNNQVYVADLDKIKYEIKGKLELKPIVTEMEAKYSFVTNMETQFIFLTNKDADNYRLITIDITKPDAGSWKNLVPEDKTKLLKTADAAWDKFMVLHYIEDAKSVLQLHEVATGKMVKKFNLDIGTIRALVSDKKYKDIFFQFESFLTPGIIYHCDLSKSSFDLEIFKEIKVKNFDRARYTVEQVFFNSKDGIKIPMFLLYKKGLQKNGNNFTFMTGYGGFGMSQLPSFYTNSPPILQNFQGIRAIPNIRGGGEYGKKWHEAGMLDKKQNVFDDFQAAAEFLIKEKYTSAKLLAVVGGSMGGLLMGACLNQRADLFGAVIADAGIMDMLRFDKFAVGHDWVTEFGTSTNDTDFQYLIRYSPLHNIKIPATPDKQYPPTMLATSDHDDRVPPLHSLKFIATLQFEAKKHQNQKNPLIIRVETESGPNANAADKGILQFVDMMSFISINTGIRYRSSALRDD